MITIAQCRAARGLLDWTQQDLSEACGLSKTAINNFEKGHSDIKADSLRAIRMAFEAAGLEFLENGVKICIERAQILKGEGAFDKLLYDIIDSTQGSDNEVLITWPDDNIKKAISETRLQEHLKQLKGFGSPIRVIAQKDAAQTLSSLGLHCRVLQKPGSEMMNAIYGTKVAIELWNSAVIVILRSEEGANAERLRFESLWSEAIDMTQRTTKNEKAGLA